MLLAVSYGVIMIFIPYQKVWRKVVAFAAIIGDFLAMLIEMEVAKLNLFSMVDGRIDVIYQIVYLLIERLDPFGDIQIAF